MAKKSKIEMNEKRKKLVAQYAPIRAELKAIIKDSQSTPEERDEARRKLQQLPRNSHPTRVRNRCRLSGRPRAYYRKFGLSRIALREHGLRGEIPGLQKSSW